MMLYILLYRMQQEYPAVTGFGQHRMTFTVVLGKKHYQSIPYLMIVYLMQVYG